MSDHVDERPTPSLTIRPSLPTLPGGPSARAAAPAPAQPTADAGARSPSTEQAGVPPRVPIVFTMPDEPRRATQPKPPTWHGRLVGLVLLLVLVAGGVISVLHFVREAGSSTADSGAAAATAPIEVGIDGGLIETGVQAIQQAQLAVLPMGDVPVPLARTAVTHQDLTGLVTADDGTRSEEHVTITDEFDAQARTAQITVTRHGAEQNGEAHYLVDDAAVYQSGEAFGAPWTKHPHDGTEAMWFSIDRVQLAPDVFSRKPESYANVTSSQETVNGVPVTTYRFDAVDATWLEGEWNDDEVARMQAAFDASGGIHFVVSVDAAGLIRSMDFDRRALVDAIGVVPGTTEVVAGHYELRSIGDGTPSYTWPTEVVDGDPWTGNLTSLPGD